MKRNLGFFILAVFLIFGACTQKPSYTIKGKVAGADGEKVLLQKIVKKQFETIDSTTVVKGEFTFKGAVDMPDLYQIQIGDNEPKEFFIENSKIEIIYNMDDSHESVVTGSKTNDLYNNFNEALEPQYAQMDELADQYAGAKKMLDTALAVGLEKQMDLLDQAITDSTISFILTHPNSIVAAFEAKALARNLNLEQMEKIVGNFTPEMQKTSYVTWMSNRVNAWKNTAVGKHFVDFSLPDTNGNMIKLSNIAGKGNYVVVDFWASWCGPCRKELPYVVKLYKQYKDKGLNIISVSCDYKRENWINGIRMLGLDWTHVSALKGKEMQVMDDYGVSGIPHLLLIDKNGIIIGRNLTAETLAEKLKEIFDKK